MVGAVTGLGFTNVRVEGTAKTPTCTGAGTANLACTVPGGNNDVVTAQVGFVNASSTATVYAADATPSCPGPPAARVRSRDR